jgi:hypothetical protein
MWCGRTLLACVILAAAGCGNPPAPPTPPARPKASGTPATPEALAIRFKASGSIIDAGEREGAFAQLTLDAAASGDKKLVDECLSEVIDAGRQERLRVQSALALGRAGRGEEALALAKTIQDANAQARIIGKIAKGDYSE